MQSVHEAVLQALLAPSAQRRQVGQRAVSVEVWEPAAQEGYLGFQVNAMSASVCVSMLPHRLAARYPAPGMAPALDTLLHAPGLAVIHRTGLVAVAVAFSITITITIAVVITLVPSEHRARDLDVHVQTLREALRHAQHAPRAGLH
eukprot:1540669-Rhodomonas_salina.1